MVLNNSPLPSARMRERVRQAAAQLGYVPNRMAQKLKLGRSFTLGVVMPYCGDSHVAAFLDALSVEASKFDFQLEIYFHRWSVREEDRALQGLGESRAEGIFLSGSRSDYRHVPILESLRRQRIPIVGLMRQAIPEFSTSIVVDRFGGAAQLGRHLAELGHRRIDYLEPIGNREAVTSLPQGVQQILDGLREGGARHTPETEVALFPTNLDHLLSRHDVEEHGFSAQSVSDLADRFIEDYLGSGSAATAVVTFHAVLAWKLLAALTSKHRRCPEDISIACFNGDGSSALGAVPLTSAEYSVDIMAQQGMAHMLKAIADQKCPPEISIPTRLVPRLSSARIY